MIFKLKDQNCILKCKNKFVIFLFFKVKVLQSALIFSLQINYINKIKLTFSLQTQNYSAMQNMQNIHRVHNATELQEQIIEVAVVIFQNVGIKRSINRIQVFKNYQIYFQICKVIFPQTMIQLFRLSQDQLSIAEKIQGVIKIVGKMLQNDLYHISGQAIAEGKLGHIKNFLHILELLSENVHKVNTKDDQVESAPENTKSISDYDQQGHYTVIGIDKEFQRSAEDDDGNFYYEKSQSQQKQEPQEEEPQTKRQFHQSSNNKPKQPSERQHKHQVQQEEKSQSQEQFQDQMGPVLNVKPAVVKKKNRPVIKRKKPTQKPKQYQVEPPAQIRPKPHSYSYNNYQLRKPREKPVNLQSVISKPQKQKRVQIKSAFLKKINNSIEDLQVKRIQDMQIQHNEWVREHQLYVVQKQNQIQHQNRQRIQFTNELIGERQKHIQSMKGQKQAVKVMANLFQEQKSIWKGMKRAKEQAQMQDILSLVASHWEDQTLLRQAILSGNNKGYGKNKVRAY